MSPEKEEIGVANSHARDPIVVTEAKESLPDQLRRREIRYVVMMGLRVVCLLTAVMVFALQVPLAPLWVALCLVGMVALPWMAVLIANDRPPKKASQFRNRLHGHPAPDRAITSGKPTDDVVGGEVIDPRDL